jgi:hypothetical protein
VKLLSLKSLSLIIKEIEAQIIKGKEKDPTSVRGVSGGVNPAVGSSTIIETT